MGDLCTCWSVMHNMMTLKHTEIKASFERSITVVEHKHNSPFYNHLQGFVSRSALGRMLDEYDRVKHVGVDSSICGCKIRTTYRLPCACELARYTMMHISIPLDAVHIHWQNLYFGAQGLSDPDTELTLLPAVEALVKRFDGLDRAGKIVLRTKVYELAFPDTSSIRPPPEKVKTKGAPNKGHGSKLEQSTRRDLSCFEHVDALHSVHDSTSTQVAPHASGNGSRRKSEMKYFDQLPLEIRPYIEGIVDVGADGNCGYRAIAALLGKGEDSWAIILDDCHRELVEWQTKYVALFGNLGGVQELKGRLLVDGAAGPDKWMTLPDMGYVIASRYNLVLIFLSSHGCMTFFPLRGRPSSSLSSHRIISIAWCITVILYRCC